MGFKRSSVFARYTEKRGTMSADRLSKLSITSSLRALRDSATIFDRKGNQKGLPRSRKQIFIENAMREVYIMMLSQKHKHNSEFNSRVIGQKKTERDSYCLWGICF